MPSLFSTPGRTVLAVALPLLIQTALFGGTRTLVIFHPGPHTIDELDPSTGKVLRSLQEGPSLPVFSPHSSKLYVMTAGGPCTAGCPGNVVVDVAQRKSTARYKVANDAFAVLVRE